MFAAIIDFFGQILQFFYNISSSIGVPNYGLAILFFTLAIKLVLFPLTRKQYITMAKMQVIQPELKKLQQKFKNDPERQNREMMALYKKHQISPLTGCLPLVIQLPILLALFRTLQTFFDPTTHPSYVNLDKASFLWVPNLGLPDPLFILPVLVAIGTFLQQKVTMQAGGVSTGQMQKMMLYFMPIFIGYISMKFPAGLAVYWVYYSIFGIIEQLLIKRPMVVKEEAGTK